MSYILDVLKKLESENKRIERNADLKEAILSDDSSSASHKKSPSISPVTAGFSASFLTILVLIIFGGGYFYYFNQKEEKKIPQAPDSQNSTQQSTISQTETNLDDVSHEIHDEEPAPDRSYHSEKKGITLATLREEEKKRTAAAPKPRPVKKSLKEQAPLPSAARSIDDELSEDFLLNQRERSDSFSSDDEDIPDFTIKGAMYVGRSARANYVLIEYDGKTHRLKEGDSAGKLKLLKLHSDKAFFRFKRRDFMRTF